MCSIERGFHIGRAGSAASLRVSVDPWKMTGSFFALFTRDPVVSIAQRTQTSAAVLCWLHALHNHNCPSCGAESTMTSRGGVD